jgi:hypothetical protein
MTYLLEGRMSQFSRPRLWFAGLLAGLVIDSIQYLLDSFVFSDNWDAVAAYVKSLATPQPPKFALSATLILGLLQVAGFGAGLLAMKFYAGQRGAGRHSVKAPAACAWALAYGPICVALIVLSATAKDPAKNPMHLAHIIAFGLSGLLGCLAGTSLGGWIYRESEAAAQRNLVQV